MKQKLNVIIIMLFCLRGCATTSYVQAPSTAKVQADVTSATQSNKQLKDLSNEERTNDRNKSNKQMIIDRWEATHPRQ